MRELPIYPSTRSIYIIINIIEFRFPAQQPEVDTAAAVSIFGLSGDIV